MIISSLDALANVYKENLSASDETSFLVQYNILNDLYIKMN